MSLARRLVLLAGLILVLLAAGRALLPFTTGPRHASSCGLVVAEAFRGAPASSATIVLTALGEKQAAAARAAAAAVRASGGDPFAQWAAGPGQDLTVNPDARFDHYTVTHLTVCTVAARRLIVGDVVLAAVALVGVAGGLLILRRPAIR